MEYSAELLTKIYLDCINELDEDELMSIHTGGAMFYLNEGVEPPVVCVQFGNPRDSAQRECLDLKLFIGIEPSDEQDVSFDDEDGAVVNLNFEDFRQSLRDENFSDPIGAKLDDREMRGG